MRARTSIALLSIAAGLLLAGCGQKGALYLPEKKATVVTPAAAATPPASGAAQPAQAGTATPKKNGQDENPQPQQPQPPPQ